MTPEKKFEDFLRDALGKLSDAVENPTGTTLHNRIIQSGRALEALITAMDHISHDPELFAILDLPPEKRMN